MIYRNLNSIQSTKKIILWRLLNLIIAIVIGPIIAYGIASINAINYDHPLRITVKTCVGAVIIIFLLLESIGIITKILDKRFSWYENIYQRYRLQNFIVIPYAIIFWLMGSLLVTFVVAGDEAISGFGIVLYFLIGLSFGLIYCFVQFIYYYFKNKGLSTVQKLQFEKEEVLAKLKGLQDQLSPHFLFNNFNTLYGLINENPKIASEFLLKLTDIYRYVLQNKENEVVSLKTELEFINKYIYLLKVRYGPNFNVNIRMSQKNIFDRFVPPLTLQILIENTYKHNYIDEDNPLHVDLFLEDDEFIVIKNSIGIPNAQKNTLKTGLSNLKARYSYLSNKNIEISESNSTYIVKVPILKIK